ncbi:DUF4194 domain-containing protein [Thalassospira sp. HF15]|uniref:DUF4194 domain-containing protein n=1 Tax=Thalassospira sp. HF15 TaxID=2722755 RepID=UPI001431AB43|nr:DUF4194 domain-containing protein [Thalassospira sp. HF15]NIY74607.1 DUF4194 domain-containing protein [Thalassospira sp. HF15]
MPAVINVKLSGEGDFGPVDLECAIPPARLPVLMAALFGQASMVSGMVPGAVQGAAQAVAGGARSSEHGILSTPTHTGVERSGGEHGVAAAGRAPKASSEHTEFGNVGDLAHSGAVDPGMFITGFVGSFGDLVARMQPRGFAETILLAAIWLQYRDGRSFVTRGDVRRLLRRQDHLRMPRNFSRDFHTAVERGYLENVENEDGYTVASDGFQWFRDGCMK